MKGTEGSRPRKRSRNEGVDLIAEHNESYRKLSAHEVLSTRCRCKVFLNRQARTRARKAGGWCIFPSGALFPSTDGLAPASASRKRPPPLLSFPVNGTVPGSVGPGATDGGSGNVPPQGHHVETVLAPQSSGSIQLSVLGGTRELMPEHEHGAAHHSQGPLGCVRGAHIAGR